CGRVGRQRGANPPAAAPRAARAGSSLRRPGAGVTRTSAAGRASDRSTASRTSRGATPGGAAQQRIVTPRPPCSANSASAYAATAAVIIEPVAIEAVVIEAVVIEAVVIEAGAGPSGTSGSGCAGQRISSPLPRS